ncbi:uncharacterized protein DS421_3g76490 [Arachis hypogaea]|nr:uncharacterized protein DS421_3g76490 [Arachis hypogaea]
MGIFLAIQICKIRPLQITSNPTKAWLRKWWSQFDSSMAYPDKIREWFKNNPHSQKVSDPETASFLNQKAQIAAALTGAQSKESLAKHLQQIMQMIEEDENTKKILLHQQNPQAVIIKMKMIALELTSERISL